MTITKDDRNVKSNVDFSHVRSKFINNSLRHCLHIHWEYSKLHYSLDGPDLRRMPVNHAAVKGRSTIIKGYERIANALMSFE